MTATAAEVHPETKMLTDGELVEAESGKTFQNAQMPMRTIRMLLGIREEGLVRGWEQLPVFTS